MNALSPIFPAAAVLTDADKLDAVILAAERARMRATRSQWAAIAGMSRDERVARWERRA